MTENLGARVAGDLRAIVDLTGRLEAQAVHKANDPEMPGGNAMASLAPVARLEAFRWQLDEAERVRDEHPDLVHEDDDWEPPLQTLCFWSEEWRVTHGMELGARRATIATEANFLRWCLEWAWDNEPHFEDFTRDVATAKRRLEDMLTEGDRAERIRVVCDRCEDNPPRLIRKYGGPNPETDGFKCPRCKHVFDPDEMKRAYAKQLRTAGMDRFIAIPEAVNVLRGQGWQERTVRRWVEPLRRKAECVECERVYPDQEYAVCPNRVLRGGAMVDCGGFFASTWEGDREAVPTGWCDIVTHKQFVWWPDIWYRHLLARNKREIRATA